MIKLKKATKKRLIRLLKNILDKKDNLSNRFKILRAIESMLKFLMKLD